jgi:hypothetical protein
MPRKRAPGGEAEYETAIQHRNLDDWWRERTTLDSDVKAIAACGVAAFISGGLDDYITPGSLRAYEVCDSPRKRLLLAPHAHGWQIALLQELQVQWLDRWLKGIDNGVERGAEGSTWTCCRPRMCFNRGIGCGSHWPGRPA